MTLLPPVLLSLSPACLISRPCSSPAAYLLLLLLLLQAYWPFHKSACRRNDFADAIEHQEPQFAAWMRKHGKLAVLQVHAALNHSNIAHAWCYLVHPVAAVLLLYYG